MILQFSTIKLHLISHFHQFHSWLLILHLQASFGTWSGPASASKPCKYTSLAQAPWQKFHSFTYPALFYTVIYWSICSIPYTVVYTLHYCIPLLYLQATVVYTSHYCIYSTLLYTIIYTSYHCIYITLLYIRCTIVYRYTFLYVC